MESLLKNKLSLANLPTPVHFYPRLSKKLGIEVFIKRDDLTESVASGNKIRKLEYVFFDAFQKKADTLVTCGGMQSNHCRATAWAAAKLGLKCSLMLREEDENHTDKNSLQGNLLINHILGADIHTYSKKQFNNFPDIKNDLCSQLEKKGKRPYFIPMGASTSTGSLGYVSMIQELEHKKQKFDHLYCAVGSGGTLAGIMLGCQYFKRNEKIHGITVCETTSFFLKELERIQFEFSEQYNQVLDISLGEQILDDAYGGIGYALNTEKELHTLLHISQLEGCILDPVYTLKAFIGMIDHIKRGIIQRGERVLFIHTGGHFGIFPKKDEIIPVL